MTWRISTARREPWRVSPCRRRNRCSGPAGSVPRRRRCSRSRPSRTGLRSSAEGAARFVGAATRVPGTATRLLQATTRFRRPAALRGRGNWAMIRQPDSRFLDDQVCVRFGRGGFLPGEGHSRRLPRRDSRIPRHQGHPPQARSLHQRRPGHDEPVPARRGVRHRGRRRDRPGSRALRALPERPDETVEQLHHRPDLRVA